ncbi:SOUL heme-binding protein [Mycolicibacterium phlei]|uniref:Heme-binding protein n=1 Tax=Mycolicibacterium phlei DSM 43239 = CCUG 21000 TaxID=1226750 RepID=A0A5N5VDA7_MYCPH|nr:heme-binding protein [Mycolicibacterium phlei]VEG11287.1 SOUL heme-binding protein [Mycobacteroides chelonae]AMO63190.1 SOUL heme-binding protein [Mycolicibacterium phlei]KAB7759943.1 heme-binding protein [Mycolicibacterium phlei DSM 43239 = CCUG 21000]KXW64311.1 heme-binding protein [Mycolicibacterium phlei DSM 43072]KXW68990.1 heme-binding protein [Mycolicibacterium phlei DSM 43239 = CCUG 21000]
MNLLALPRQTVEGLLATVGIRVGTEEPHHLSTPLTGRVQLRRYGPRIAAETTVDADEERARNIGFRRLAGYIFGANHRSESIAMTAPVAQGDTIAMTAPVAQSRSTIRFYMPSKWTMDTLPAPDDDRVRLVKVPGETVAVLRFSGDRSPRAVATHTAELLDTLRANDIEVTGEPQAWFYDPPWTLPLRRRNEIAVTVRD